MIDGLIRGHGRVVGLEQQKTGVRQPEHPPYSTALDSVANGLLLALPSLPPVPHNPHFSCVPIHTALLAWPLPRLLTLLARSPRPVLPP